MYIMNNLETSKIGYTGNIGNTGSGSVGPTGPASVTAVTDIVDVIPDPIPDKINTLVQNVSQPEESPNVLNVYKTVVTHLISFEIIIIRVVPYTMASIDIQILTDKGHIYRTVNLVGPDYLKWSASDLYLFEYTRANIDTIY
jgi:hypothetical protein